MPAAHEVKFEEKSGGNAVCAAALATVKAAAMPPARSCAVEANLDIVLSVVSSPAGPGRTCSRMNPRRHVACAPECPLFPRASLLCAGRCIAFWLEIGTVTTRSIQVHARIFARGGDRLGRRMCARFNPLHQAVKCCGNL